MYYSLASANIIIHNNYDKQCTIFNSTLQLLRCITLIPAHSCQKLHDDIGIFGSLGTISQTAKKIGLDNEVSSSFDFSGVHMAYPIEMGT